MFLVLFLQAPTPKTFRGKFDADESNLGHLYANEVLKLIQKARQNEREVRISI